MGRIRNMKPLDFWCSYSWGYFIRDDYKIALVVKRQGCNRNFSVQAIMDEKLFGNGIVGQYVFTKAGMGI